jgi:hypothetical protein
MSAHTSDKKLILTLDIEELTPAQVRLIKSVHSTLAHVLTTENEGEYFEASAEIMKICASLIKQSHFANTGKKEKIAYADQALEYSMDMLNEHVTTNKSLNFNN